MQDVKYTLTVIVQVSLEKRKLLGTTDITKISLKGKATCRGGRWTDRYKPGGKGVR